MNTKTSFTHSKTEVTPIPHDSEKLNSSWEKPDHLSETEMASPPRLQTPTKKTLSDLLLDFL